MLYNRLLICGLLLAFWAGAMGSGSAEGLPVRIARPAPPGSPELLPPRAAPLASRDGLTLYRASSRELKLARSLLSLRAGEGGGANVAGLIAIQTLFSDPTRGNEVLIIWTEETVNVDGIRIIVDGILLGTFPGLAAVDLPGTAGGFITNVPDGNHVFRVETDDSFSEASLEVLATQPFADASNLVCASGPRLANGNCAMELSWDLAGTPPLYYVLLFDGAAVAEVPGALQNFTLLDVPPGAHEVVLVGFLEIPAGIYRGAFVLTACDIQCLDVPCNPPFSLFLCQVGYGPGPTDGVLLVEWQNGEDPYPVGISVQQDGTEVVQVPGDTTAIFLPGVPSGDHRIGVQGDCGEMDGPSGIAEARFNVLAATPHSNPISGDIVCSFDPETAAMSASWTLADPSIQIGVFEVAVDGLVLVGYVPGDTQGVTVSPATEATQLAIQFYVEVDGACYGSEVIGCVPETPPKRYIQGVCNGIGDSPQITSAIFGLAFLFTGGAAPPCRKACDGNGDGRFDLSDMVYVLSYLFLGGPAPTLWVDGDQNGSPEPTCVAPAPEDDCETGHEACAG